MEGTNAAMQKIRAFTYMLKCIALPRIAPASSASVASSAAGLYTASICRRFFCSKLLVHADALLPRGHRDHGRHALENISVSAAPFGSPLRPDFHHFRAALRAPSAGNRVNEIAAQATDFQRAGECVWLAFLTLFRCLIFEDHNHVHGRVPTWRRGFICSFIAALSERLFPITMQVT
jgi:hypothetical protein